MIIFKHPTYNAGSMQVYPAAVQITKWIPNNYEKLSAKSRCEPDL